MERPIMWILLFGMLGSYVACSPKKFARDPSYNACQNSGQNCITQNGRDYFSVSETVGGGKIDVLVVTDNSASMSREQAALANRFSGFISNLENKKMSYRIGVVTTDISSAVNRPRTINRDGDLQDGRLIPLPNGDDYLTNESGSLSEKDRAFKATVQRPETLSCETFILNQLSQCRSQGLSKEACQERSSYISAYDNHCPSGDERGIFAARLVLEKNPSRFIRKDADLAIIVLSDEDVRGGLYRGPYREKGETHMQSGEYSLTDKDSASSFLSFMVKQYPNKPYNVHAITVPYHTDPTCTSKQASQTGGMVGASIGYQYEVLAAAIQGQKKVAGVRSSICESSYSAALQSIFDQVQSEVIDRVALACANPPDVNVSVTGPNGGSMTMAWTLVADEIRFSQKIPVGASIKVTYSCETL